MNFQLEKAIRYEQNIRKVKSLLKKGVNVNVRIRGYLTPLHLAVLSENSQMVSLLLENGASVTAKDQYGNIPIHKAPDVSITKLLLEYGSPVNVKNNQRETPLHIAARRGASSPHDDATAHLKLLIKNGASVNARDNGNNTPLHKVCSRSIESQGIQDKEVRVLLDHGALVNVKNNICDTPLILAMNHLYRVSTGSSIKDIFRRDQSERAQRAIVYLLNAGANPNVGERTFVGGKISCVGVQGKTPLHVAAEIGIPDIVTHLLTAGAKPNQKDYIRGETALHIAVAASSWKRMSHNGHVKIVQQLLDAGANPIAKDNLGITPLQKARESKREDLETVLEKALNRLKVTAIKSMNKYHVPNDVKWRILANMEMINRLRPKKRKRNNAS